MADKEPAQARLLPEGRLINHSLFELDQYIPAKGQPGTPAYKVELAFEKDALNDIFNACLDFAVETWGEGADEDVIIPIIDGDNLAAKREKLNKPGDAYKGMDVVRANTIFNKDGDKAPGGIQVLAPDTSEIGPANRSEVYQGCYGKAAITFSGYTKEGTGNEPDRNAITFYLVAFQKTKDGERLVTPKDHSNLFKPVGRKPDDDTGEESSGGKRRKAG